MRKVDQLLVDQPGVIGWGANSGFQALNLAVQLGARRILLCGFDCSLEKGTHWHGRHPSPLDNPRQASVDRWGAALDAQAPFVESLGIPVINCASHSRLAAFPRRPLMEALADDRDQL